MRQNTANIRENRLIFYNQGPEGPKIIDPNELAKSLQNKPEVTKAPEDMGLSKENSKSLKDETKTIEDIVWERKQEKAQAEAKIFEARKLNPDLIDDADQQTLLNELKAAETDEEIEDAIYKIENIAKLKEAEKTSGKLEEKELDFEHKDIKKYRGDIHETLSNKEAIEWIGTKQASKESTEGAFEKWCIEKLKKSPSIKNAKQILFDLENHKNGIKPRREFYERQIEPIVKKSGLKLDSYKYLKEEGLSERKEFMIEAKKAEAQIDTTSDEWWTPDAKKEMLQEVLKSESPQKAKEKLKDIKEIKRIEGEGFTHAKGTETINGVSLKRMSNNSKRFFINDLKDLGDIKKRKDYITKNGEVENGIIDTAENELSLAKENVSPSTKKDFGITEGLSGIYKNDQDGLKSALEGFKTLDFMQKIESLKRHTKLVEKNEKSIVKKSQEQLNDSLNEIEKARAKKTLSDKDAKKFRDWASDTTKYTDSNGKIDLKEQKKRHDKMTATEAIYVKEHRNIKAYELLREKKFTPLYEQVKKDNPNMPLAELKKWQIDYDKGSFSERKEVYMKLKEKAAELKEKRDEKEKREEEAGITKSDKMNAIETMKTDEVILVVAKWEALDTPESIKKAYETLTLFTSALIENNEQIPLEILAMQTRVNKRYLEISRGVIIDETREAKVEEATKQVTKDQFDKEMTQTAVVGINIEQTDKNETLHKDAGTDVEERAEAANKEQAHGDKEKIGIIEDFYEAQRKESGSNEHSHVIKTEGRKTGEDVTTVTIDKDMTSEEIQKHETAIRDHRSKITKNKGFEHSELKTKDGKTVDSTEGAAKYEKEKTSLFAKIAERTAKAMQKENKIDKPKTSFSSAADEVAAKRATERLLEEKEENILKKAA